jgi:glycosyltransferase involved in cell wall biosynthesis
MRLIFLAPANVIHTQRWVNEMMSRGHVVHLVSIHTPISGYHQAVTHHALPFPAPSGYYLNAFALRRIVKGLNPDLIHVHYASGYGTLARIARVRPCLLSVWGSDVYDFPYESPLKMRIIRKNLRWANQIASTSHAMKAQTEKLINPVHQIEVTPFGVDCRLFSPMQKPMDSSPITLGTVKTLLPKYGIDILLRAFRIIRDHSEQAVRLVIVGGGPEERNLKQLAVELQIQDQVEFIGPVPHADVPKWLNQFDIYLALSTLDSESFGVAIIEASACGIPVIVSRVGGLPEVVQDGVTGLVVDNRDFRAAADKALMLIRDWGLRQEMGRLGRSWVMQQYEWSKTACIMENVYNDMLNSINDSCLSHK